ncbi:sulfate ABC transporter permease subunit [Alicyclobacillus kakegawensis]|uniref:sulfate ABC transporter permease subunit n=1 Tax=Alicyclobacillus kakegawensis TaxID=392012 RepID=UPI000A8BFCAD
MKMRMALSAGVYLWFLILILIPAITMVEGALSHGVNGFFAQVLQPEAVSALRLSFLITALTLLINLPLGVITALLIARRSFPGWQVVNAVVDLPFALSPVIAGLALLLVYGPNTLLGAFLQNHGVKVMFALPGMVLATLLVTFPLVVRELVPLLRQLGLRQEEAAWTLGASAWRTFWLVTLPRIRFGLGYSAVLTIARALGEFGAVLVVSGNLVGVTQTATLYVYQATENNDLQAADAVSTVLALVSFVILILMQVFKGRGEGRIS